MLVYESFNKRIWTLFQEGRHQEGGLHFTQMAQMGMNGEETPMVSLLSLSLITMALNLPAIKPQWSGPQELIFWNKEEDTAGSWSMGVNSE